MSPTRVQVRSLSHKGRAEARRKKQQPQVSSNPRTKVAAQEPKRTNHNQYQCTYKRLPHSSPLPMVIQAFGTSITGFRADVTPAENSRGGSTRVSFNCKTTPWSDQMSTVITLHMSAPRSPVTTTSAATRISVLRHVSRYPCNKK